MTAPVFAQGARSQLLFKSQTDFLTQATGNYTKARFNTHTLDLKKATIQGAEIRSDRQIEDYRHAQYHTEGDIAVDLLYADHDWLLQSMMFGTYSGSNLTTGTTPQYYSLEDGALDINQYRMFTGYVAGKAAFDFKPNQIVKATFSMVGGSMTQTGGSGGGTPVAPSNNKPFDTFNAGVYAADSASGSKLAVVSSLALNIDNAVAATNVIGYQAPQALQFGRQTVTGTMVVYYADGGFINNFINENEVALDLTLTDPSSNTLSFSLPRIKYNGGAVPVQNETARMVTLPFIALRDTVSGNQLKITK